MTDISINRQVELKASFEWIKSSFFAVREKPLQFIILGIISGLIGIIPVLGAFMSPIFTTKFAQFAQQVEQSESIAISDIFNDLFANITVVKLAWLNATLNVILLLLQYSIDNYVAHGVSFMPGLLGGSLIVILTLFIPATLLLFAMWLSPLICYYNPEIDITHAMGLSMKVCCFNIAALFLYSIFVVMFTILAFIPFGLGLLIWLPVLNTANYYIYKSVLLVTTHPMQR